MKSSPGSWKRRVAHDHDLAVGLHPERRHLVDRVAVAYDVHLPPLPNQCPACVGVLSASAPAAERPQLAVALLPEQRALPTVEYTLPCAPNRVEAAGRRGRRAVDQDVGDVGTRDGPLPLGERADLRGAGG